MKTYKIIGNGDEVLPVKGQPIIIKEYRDIELFIHKPLRAFLSGPVKNHPFTDIISEVLTGRTVGRGTTRKDAVDDAIYKLRDAGGYAKVKKLIKKSKLI